MFVTFRSQIYFDTEVIKKIHLAAPDLRYGTWDFSCGMWIFSCGMGSNFLIKNRTGPPCTGSRDYNWATQGSPNTRVFQISAEPGLSLPTQPLSKLGGSSLWEKSFPPLLLAVWPLHSAPALPLGPGFIYLFIYFLGPDLIKALSCLWFSDWMLAPTSVRIQAAGGVPHPLSICVSIPTWGGTSSSVSTTLRVPTLGCGASLLFPKPTPQPGPYP